MLDRWLDYDHCSAAYSMECCTIQVGKEVGMAKQVGYFEDFDSPEREAEAYNEGPFVIVNVFASGFRIECEVKGLKHPCLPDYSVYKHAEAWRQNMSKSTNAEIIGNICDWLNTQVKLGNIVLCGKVWVAPKFLGTGG